MSRSTINPLSLHFGQDAVWEIVGSPRIASFLSSSLEPISDLDSSIEQALSNPIDFPSLDQALVPGDSLVFAVDPVLPEIDHVVPKVLGWFARRGTSPGSMSVVLAGNHSAVATSLSQSILGTLGENVSVEIHDPDDTEHIAYLAANDDADPIYMNRTLVDADVVVPITCCRSPSALDYFGAYAIYPLLSDRATRAAFYQLERLKDASSHHKLTCWANQAARWAGFMVEVQVVPVGGNRIGSILAGLTEPLEIVSRERMKQAWDTHASPADLTIALLDGGQSQQNWLGIARALHVADLCTNDGGAMVVCTQVNAAIGKSLGRLQNSQSSKGDLSRKLSSDTSDDAILASLVHQATQHKHIYLVSDMKSESVESLGLGVIREPSELAHLIDQFSSTIILGSAQHRNLVLETADGRT